MANPIRPATGDVVETSWGLDVADTVVRRYANAAARDADLGAASGRTGQLVWLTDAGHGSGGALYVSDGTAWEPVSEGGVEAYGVRAPGSVASGSTLFTATSRKHSQGELVEYRLVITRSAGTAVTLTVTIAGPGGIPDTIPFVILKTVTLQLPAGAGTYTFPLMLYLYNEGPGTLTVTITTSGSAFTAAAPTWQAIYASGPYG